jgi:hypothetical protein
LGESTLEIGDEYNMFLGQEGAECSVQGPVEGDHPHHRQGEELPGRMIFCFLLVT